MTPLTAVVRGLAHRGGSSVMILAVALVAAAGAAAGPAYYSAAKISILHDTVEGGLPLGRAFEANLTGPVDQGAAPLADAVRGEVDADLGHGAASRVFAPPVASVEGTGTYRPDSATFVLAWRAGMCAHLRIAGACPSAPRQVLVSRAAARLTGWRPGQRITGAGWPALTVTGVYQPPRLNSDYWAMRVTTYFPMEAPPGASRAGVTFDAMFTPLATLTAAPATQQGAAVIDDFLDLGRLRASDVPAVQSAMAAFSNSVALSGQNVVVSTTIPGALARVRASWRTVAAPVFLITAALLALGWLLLFLVVTDAVEARGPEVALARLRGQGRWRILVFGLSEPAVLLLAAFPAGAAVGWAAAAALDGATLRAGTPAAMPPLAWLAAAGATTGGLTAVLLAARRTLRRGVVEQFRHSGRRAADRGWVVDAILLTGAVAGLLDLLVTGTIATARQSALILCVPALLGLAVAVVASRLLPLACRAAYRVTGRRGGLAAYLAVRHIARRPGGVRTTIVLATAFTLAAFAVAAWSVGRDNYQVVAGARVGAPTVLAVTVPPGKDLGAIVGRADPSGRLATAVDSYVSLTSGSAGDVTLGVDPQRFARIAFWPRRFAREPLTTLAPRLDPPAPAPLTLTGDAMRVTVRVSSLSLAGEQLSANVTTGASPVSLGSLPARGAVRLTGALVGCPCVLQSLALSLSGPQIERGGLQNAVSGRLTITGLQVRDHGRWRPPRPQALASAAAWREGQPDNPPDVISAGPAGLTWSFSGVPGKVDPTLASVNRPAVLPALIPSALLAGRTGTFAGLGLDGSPLALRPVAAVAAAPGAPGYGVVVDRHYAELAAGEDLSHATRQVWLAAGAAPLIVPKLKAAGVRIGSQESAAAVAAALSRQGPGLASVLFLADAGAAALLAAGAAMLGLYLSGRRRRYEYAALEASGLRRRALRRAVLIELAVVLGYGVAVGVTTGLASARVVLRSVPEFVSVPAAPPLSYAPPTAPLAALLGAAAALLVVVCLAASAALIRGVRPDQLREAPP